MQIHPSSIQNNLKNYFDPQLYVLSHLKISDELYQTIIGSHLRHCIQMIEIFLSNYRVGLLIDYTKRDRDSQEAQKIVSSQEYGVDRLNHLFNQLFILNIDDIKLDVKRDFGEFKSTIELELDFLASHTMHHFGLIRIFLEKDFSDDSLGYFGYAPETIEYLKNKKVN